MVKGDLMERQIYGSGGPWEGIVGYSRTVRVGNIVYVAGTTSVDENGNIVAQGDPYGQAMQVMRNIERALKMAGAKMEHVVRTRMFVINIADWEQIGRAHGEFFRDIRPVATMVEVKALIDPALLVEIEVEAVIHDA
jgi:enamine deaminase RidA (YjgF/YER057c/UK114 family)